jgi:hypothetical protein
MTMFFSTPQADWGRRVFGVKFRRAPAEGFYLRTADCYVNGVDVVSDPLVSMLLVEDACWSAMSDDWLRRRPPRLHRASFRRWRAEGAALHAERTRLRAVAMTIGVTTPGGIVETIGGHVE